MNNKGQTILTSSSMWLWSEFIQNFTRPKICHPHHGYK